jgi:hypothetical protein
VNFVHLSPHDCLIRHLANYCINLAPSDVAKTVIVLPTRRAERLLMAQIALRSEKMASFSPQFCSLDQLMRQTMMIRGLLPQLIANKQLELLFQNFLSVRQENYSHLDDRNAHEVLHLLKELYRQGQRNVFFENAKTWLSDQWMRSTDSITLMHDRLGEIESAIHDFEQYLTERHLSLPEREEFLLFQSDKSAIGHHPLLQGRHLILAGLTSLSRNQIVFVSSLLKAEDASNWPRKPQVTVFGFDGRDFNLNPAVVKNNLFPITAMQNLFLNQSFTQQANETTNIDSIKSWPIQTIQAFHTPLQEVKATLQTIQSLIKEEFAAAHRIVVAVSQESVYSEMIHSLAPNFLDEFNCPLPIPWTTSRIGQWWSLASDYHMTGSTRTLGQILIHPLSSVLAKATANGAENSNERDLQTAVLNWLSNAAPEVLEAKNLANGIQEQDGPIFTLTKRIKNLLPWLGLSQAERSKGSAFPLQDNHWMKWLDGSLDVSIAPCQTSLSQDDLVNWSQKMESMAEDLLRLMLQELMQVHECCTIADETFDASQFFKFVLELSSDHPMRPIGEPLAGVQILSLTEARFVPCDHMFMVGMIEELFPSQLPKDTLIDNNMLEACSMPGWSQLSALEEITFQSFMARLASVHMSYPLFMGGKPTIKSRWIEQFEALNDRGIQTIIKGQAAKKKAVPTNSFLASDLEEGAFSNFDTFPSLSASKLRTLMQCPYQFRLHQFKVKPLDFPENLRKRLNGTRFHHIIQLGLADTIGSGTYNSENLDQESLTDLLTSAFCSRTKLEFQDADFYQSEVQDLLYGGWKELAEFLCSLHGKGYRLDAMQCEYAFQRGSDLPSQGPRDFVITYREKGVPLRGAIDLLAWNENTNTSLILDFKTSSIPSISDARSGKEPQLGLYALILFDGGKRPFSHIETGYFSLAERKFTPISALDHAAESTVEDTKSKRTSTRKQDYRSLDLATSVVASWDRIRAQIETAGRFFANPSSCNFCQFEGICRKRENKVSDRMTTFIERLSGP